MRKTLLLSEYKITFSCSCQTFFPHITQLFCSPAIWYSMLLCVRQTVEAPYCKSLYLMSTNTFVLSFNSVHAGVHVIWKMPIRLGSILNKPVLLFLNWTASLYNKLISLLEVKFQSFHQVLRVQHIILYLNTIVKKLLIFPIYVHFQNSFRRFSVTVYRLQYFYIYLYSIVLTKLFWIAKACQI